MISARVPGFASAVCARTSFASVNVRRLHSRPNAAGCPIRTRPDRARPEARTTCSFGRDRACVRRHGHPERECCQREPAGAAPLRHLRPGSSRDPTGLSLAGHRARRTKEADVFRKMVRPLLAGMGAAGALVLVNRGLGRSLPDQPSGRDTAALDLARRGDIRSRGRRWPLGRHGARNLCGRILVRIPPPFSASRTTASRRRVRLSGLRAFGCAQPGIRPRPVRRADRRCARTIQRRAHHRDPVRRSAQRSRSVRRCAPARACARWSRSVRPAWAASWTAARTPARTLATPLLRAPLVGESVYNVLASRQYIRRFLEKDVYGDPSAVTGEVVDNWLRHVTHQPGARWVPAAFIGGRLDCDVARDLPFLEAPLLVLWGKRAATVNPARNAAEYAELAKNAQIEYYVKSGLLPHEEEAELVAVSSSRIDGTICPLPFDPSIFKSYDVRTRHLPVAVRRRRRLPDRPRVRRRVRHEEYRHRARHARVQASGCTKRSRRAQPKAAPA